MSDQHHAPAALPPVPIVQKAGWSPEPVWTGAENFASTGIASPDRPARSESLCRLSYPGPSKMYCVHSNSVPIRTHELPSLRNTSTLQDTKRTGAEIGLGENNPPLGFHTEGKVLYVCSSRNCYRPATFSS